jgi:hypothetical protein
LFKNGFISERWRSPETDTLKPMSILAHCGDLRYIMESHLDFEFEFWSLCAKKWGIEIWKFEVSMGDVSRVVTLRDGKRGANFRPSLRLNLKYGDK